VKIHALLCRTVWKKTVQTQIADFAPVVQATVCTYRIFIVEHNLVGIDAVVSAVTPSPLRNTLIQPTVKS